MEELKELLKQREDCLKEEIDDTFYEKIEGGECLAGRSFKVYWNDLSALEFDVGYFFDLPVGNNSDEYDVFLSIPKPINISGMDTPPPVFCHLQYLITNKLLQKISID